MGTYSANMASPDISTGYLILGMSFMFSFILLISSTNMFCSLACLEICSVCIVVWVSGLGGEGSMRYMCAQAIGSMALFLFLLKGSEFSLAPMLWKLGVAPFHSWVIPTSLSLNTNQWVMAFLVGKIPALFFTGSFLSVFSLSWIFGFTAVWGGFLLFNSGSINYLLGASSISQMGWVMSDFQANFWWLYASYIMSVLFSIWGNLGMGLFLLSGVPPSLIFLAKVGVLWELGMDLQSVCLVVGSCLSLFSYLKFSQLYMFNNAALVNKNKP